MLHFRQHSVVDVEDRRMRSWKRIIEDRLIIPATEIKVYDEDGTTTGKIRYCDQTVTFMPLPNTSTFAPEIHTNTHINPTNTSDFDPAYTVPTSLETQGDLDTNSSSPHTSREPASISLDTQGDSEQEQENSESFTSEQPTLSKNNTKTLVQTHVDTSTGEGSVITPGPATRSHIHLPALEEECAEGLTTSLATSIRKLLPNESLSEFDTLRFRLKEVTAKNTTRINTKHMTAKYKLLTAKIGNKVSSKQIELDQLIQDLENQHFRQHGILPAKNNNAPYHNLLRQKKLAKAILTNIGV